MSIAAGDKAFYYMTRESLCFLAMAEARYPKRLAFLYLDEIGDLVLGELLKEFGNQVRRTLLVFLHPLIMARVWKDCVVLVGKREDDG